MFIRDLKNSKEIIAGDEAILRELFNPNNDDLKIGYSLAHAVVKVGEQSKLHLLKTSEVYYILEGSGEMHINKESEIVSAGQAIYVPASSEQYIINKGDADLKFLCIVDPAWRLEDEEII